MPRIDLKGAISHIRQACDSAGQPGDLPFFFIVGAGVSQPVVPLASDIERHCRDEAARHGRTKECPRKSKLDAYSHWFQEAYPQPVQRQKYLRSLIEKKSIPQANLRLAHILATKKVANLVVTPSFDDFLSRALELFGQAAIVCDHPSTVERIDPERDDLQIVHVHGTYWFYDCCNLRGEIEGRARSSPETSLTMASFLDRLLANRSPLVVGYSGWEDDVIMTALKRRLVNRTPPHNVYWFCYNQQDVRALPKELAEHPNVYVIEPEAPSPEGAAGSRPGLVPDAVPRGQELTASLAGAEGEPVLPAHQVFDRLIEGWLPTPELTRDPLGFLLGLLRRSLPLTDEAEGQRSPYLFANVVARVEQAQQREQDAIKAIQEVERSAERILEDVRGSRYSAAVETVAELHGLERLSENQLRDLVDAMGQATRELYGGDPAQSLLASDSLLRLLQALEGRGIPLSGSLAEQLGEAVVGKVVSLFDQARVDEVPAFSDDLVQRYSQASDPLVQEAVGLALSNKGVALLQTRGYRKAVEAFDQAIERFGEATSFRAQYAVAGTLYNKGRALRGLRRRDDAVSIWQQVVKRFGQAKETNSNPFVQFARRDLQEEQRRAGAARGRKTNVASTNRSRKPGPGRSPRRPPSS